MERIVSTLALMTVLVFAGLPGAASGLNSEFTCGDDVDSAESSCGFQCRPGGLSVKVTAKDKSDWTGDVIAWGRAQCGDGQASCSERDSCVGQSTTTMQDSGMCSAGTKEKIHDGFIYFCQGSAKPHTDGGSSCWVSPLIPDNACPSKPGGAPANPCGGFALVVPEDLPCPGMHVGTTEEVIVTTVSTFVGSGVALGEVCNLSDGCELVVPQCLFLEDETRCATGSNSRLMTIELLFEILRIA